LKDIEAKAREKSDLLEFINHLKKEIKRINDEKEKLILKNKKDITNAYASQTKPQKSESLPKDLEKYKRETGKLADIVQNSQKDLALLEKRVDTERSLLEELEDIINKMKNEIAHQKKSCEKVRKDLISQNKKCGQLKQKAENIVFFSTLNL